MDECQVACLPTLSANNTVASFGDTANNIAPVFAIVIAVGLALGFLGLLAYALSSAARYQRVRHLITFLLGTWGDAIVGAGVVGPVAAIAYGTYRFATMTDTGRRDQILAWAGIILATYAVLAFIGHWVRRGIRRVQPTPEPQVVEGAQ
jgi:hypothetical protein